MIQGQAASVLSTSGVFQGAQVLRLELPHGARLDEVLYLLQVDERQSV